MTVLLASLIVTSLAQLAVLVFKGGQIENLKKEVYGLKINNLELQRKVLESSILMTTQAMQYELRIAVLAFAELDLGLHKELVISLKAELQRRSEEVGQEEG